MPLAKIKRFQLGNERTMDAVGVEKIWQGKKRIISLSEEKLNVKRIWFRARGNYFQISELLNDQSPIEYQYI